LFKPRRQPGNPAKIVWLAHLLVLFLAGQPQMVAGQHLGPKPRQDQEGGEILQH
jgi:hypothetical protein